MKSVKFSKYIIALCILVLFACKTLQVTDEQAKYEAVKTITPDTTLVQLIAPYKSQLDAAMNIQIGWLEKDVEKKTSLSNMMADILFANAPDIKGAKADAAITNIGGIRVPFLAAGALKKADAYKLMPFDNTIVALRIDGQLLHQWLAHTAQWGGWPIAGISFTINADKTIDNVRINGVELDVSKQYWIVTTDYIAGGGDQCEFLKSIPVSTDGKLYRDAIMSYWQQFYQQGIAVPADSILRIQNVQ